MFVNVLLIYFKTVPGLIFHNTNFKKSGKVIIMSRLCTPDNIPPLIYGLCKTIWGDKGFLGKILT